MYTKEETIEEEVTVALVSNPPFLDVDPIKISLVLEDDKEERLALIILTSFNPLYQLLLQRYLWPHSLPWLHQWGGLYFPIQCFGSLRVLSRGALFSNFMGIRYRWWFCWLQGKGSQPLLISQMMLNLKDYKRNCNPTKNPITYHWQQRNPTNVWKWPHHFNNVYSFLSN